jgi:hypothetical protein
MCAYPHCKKKREVRGKVDAVEDEWDIHRYGLNYNKKEGDDCETGARGIKL